MEQPKSALVLLVEDDHGHAELAKRSLRNQADKINLVVVNDVTSASLWLTGNTPNLLISDLHLPDGLGTTFLDDGKDEAVFPVVIITSLDDENLAIDIIKAGATDYIVKTPEMYRDLGHIIQRTLASWENYIERNQALALLRENEAKYRSIFENSPVGVLYFDRNGIITACNESLEKIIGTNREGMLGLHLAEASNSGLARIVKAVLRGEKVNFDSNYQSMTSGKAIPVRGIFSPILLPDGSVAGGVGIVEDITQQKKAELLQTSLFRIAEAANIAKDLFELYQQIHLIIQTLLPADNFYISLWDQSTNIVSLPYHVDQYDENPGAWQFGHGLTEYVLRTGKSLLADPQVYYELESKGEVVNVGTPSVDWLGVPLKDTDKNVFGALVVQSYTEGVRYSEQDMGILEYVSSQIAIVIQRRRAEEAERQQRLLAEALLDTTSAINSSLELNEVFERILLNLEKLAPYDLALIMLLDGDIATTVSIHGPYKDKKGIIHKFNWREIYGFKLIYETAQPRFIPKTKEDPHWVIMPGTEWIASYAGIPLINKDKVIGFLNLNFEKENRFVSAMVKGLQAFANQAAKAIENARLYAEVQQLAILDDLTGLYNRRGLAIFGKREFERSHRFHRDLSVLFSDIDDFKMFNDRYSYATGDQVLRMLADCMRTNLREIDVISRFGGDEFVALLPETSAAAALDISERLRKAVNSMKLGVNGKDLHISISCGIYTSTASDQSLENLLDKAGDRLHRAKLNGKNTIASSD